MTLRQRAVLASDKAERHNAILDATARLLARAPDRVASVAEVADEAGLAKGTVYLYFPGKEALLLALHERNVSAFFDDLEQRLDEGVTITVDEVLSIVRRHMIESPLFLPLASRCLGVMRLEVAANIREGFRARMAGRLDRIGRDLERRFRALGAGCGVTLLRNSFALTLGLWQLSASKSAAADVDAGAGRSEGVAGTALDRTFADDLDRALDALWRGTLADKNAGAAH